jgi:protoheme IX farnesyltransferase
MATNIEKLNQKSHWQALKLYLRSLRKGYWPLIKSLQTGLLLATGLAGFTSARCPVTSFPALLGLTGSLFLAISGSTVLNMYFDRDLDAKMARTRSRPLPSGRVRPDRGLRFGLALSLLGLVWAVLLSPLYALVVFAGLTFDVGVYTIWLKRRTAWSIVWGGISGGMPILAGRALAMGVIDWVAFHMRYFADYQRAGVPTFPSSHGFKTTRLVIAISSVLAALAIGGAAAGIGMTWGYLRVLAVLSVGLFGLAIKALAQPSEKLHFGLFKYASLYMLSAMLLFVVEAM